jgi:hypothetical protein
MGFIRYEGVYVDGLIDECLKFQSGMRNGGDLSRVKHTFSVAVQTKKFSKPKRTCPPLSLCANTPNEKA